jgi:hypothetical protein
LTSASCGSSWKPVTHSSNPGDAPEVWATAFRRATA